MREDHDHMCEDGDGAVLRTMLASYVSCPRVWNRTRKAPAKKPLTASVVISSGGSMSALMFDGGGILYSVFYHDRYSVYSVFVVVENLYELSKSRTGTGRKHQWISRRGQATTSLVY